MKRSWIGCGLLVVLLILGLLGSWGISKTHDPAVRDLEAAARQALEEHWEQAQVLLDRAEQHWERGRWLRECLSDKSPVEEIEAGLAGLRPLLEQREEGEFASACAELAVKVAAVGEAHQIHWGNLL